MQNNLFEETIQLIKKYTKLYSKLFINKEQLHISQDKLIGSIVHEAAHQASGK